MYAMGTARASPRGRISPWESSAGEMYALASMRGKGAWRCDRQVDAVRHGQRSAGPRGLTWEAPLRDLAGDLAAILTTPRHLRNARIRIGQDPADADH